MLRYTFALAALLFGMPASAHTGRVDADGCHVESSNHKEHCHPERARKKAVSMCVQRAPIAGDEGVLFGRVTRVVDGDTFKVKIQGVSMDFRLSDIDAPELDQPFGDDARRILDAAIDGETVFMRRVETDSRGRFVVHVWLGELYVNRELVSRGAAWFYPEYARGDCLHEIEQGARDGNRGLWALPLPQRLAPWEWREAKRKRPAR